MARIANVVIPDQKQVQISLTYIYGIGPSTARYILEKAGVDVNKKVNAWDDDEQNAIRNIITNEFKVEGQLRSEVQMSIKRLLDIACYRAVNAHEPTDARAVVSVSQSVVHNLKQQLRRRKEPRWQKQLQSKPRLKYLVERSSADQFLLVNCIYRQHLTTRSSLFQTKKVTC